MINRAEAMLDFSFLEVKVEYSQIKKYITNFYKEHNIQDDECDFLLTSIFNLPLSRIITKQFSKDEFKKIQKFLKKRAKHIPLDIIFHNKNFYGYDFFVNKNVLTPRKETELLVENVLQIAKDNQKVLDLCTGSGAIAIAIKKQNPLLDVTGSDYSAKALKVAKMNAKKHNFQIKFLKSNLFKKVNEKFDVIVSNPPYISQNEYKNLSQEVKKYDAKMSLVAKNNGLYFYEKIFQNANDYLFDGSIIMVEIGQNQGQNVKKIAQKYNFSCQKSVLDYSKIERILIFKKGEQNVR